MLPVFVKEAHPKRIACDEMEVVHGDMIFIHLFWFIAMRHKQDVSLHILFHHKPRTATKAKPFALTDCIEPQSLVFTYLSSCLYLSHIAGVFSKMGFDIVAEINIAQEADTLTVFPFGIEQMGFLGHLTNLMFPHVTYWEHEFADLKSINLTQEVCLILHGVW